MIQQNKKIILASQSPRRKAFLEEQGLHIDTIPSFADESIFTGTAREIAKQATQSKISTIREMYKQSFECIIAADTIVEVDGNVLGKPESEVHAFEMIQLLSNKSHQVCTFYRVELNSGEFREESVQTKVWVSLIPDSVIKSYIQTKEPYDKSGGYAIQGFIGGWIDHIEGSFTNVVGLPVSNVMRSLKELCVITF